MPIAEVCICGINSVLQLHPPKVNFCGHGTYTVGMPQYGAVLGQWNCLGPISFLNGLYDSLWFEASSFLPPPHPFPALTSHTKYGFLPRHPSTPSSPTLPLLPPALRLWLPSNLPSTANDPWVPACAPQQVSVTSPSATSQGSPSLPVPNSF